jgi:hypothetical protein
MKSYLSRRPVKYLALGPILGVLGYWAFNQISNNMESSIQTNTAASSAVGESSGSYEIIKSSFAWPTDVKDLSTLSKTLSSRRYRQDSRNITC